MIDSPTPIEADVPPETGSEAWRKQLQLAKQRRRRIDNAAVVAAFNGWIAAGLAVVSLPLALFSPWNILASVVLGVTAFVELRGRRMLKRLDPRGPAVLALNQATFAVIVVGYAVWRLVVAAMGEGHYAQVIAEMPELADTLGPLNEVYQLAEYLIYSIIIIATIFMQGGMAIYYLVWKYVVGYLNEEVGIGS